MTFKGNSPFGSPSQPGPMASGPSPLPPQRPSAAVTPRASSNWVTVAWIVATAMLTVVLGAGAAFVDNSRGGSTAGETGEVTSVPFVPREQTGESEESEATTPTVPTVTPSTTAL
ncbi:hypothetical protein [Corynebacterium doosanense]|uniref:hypothetical protein n=1 Tax=Corynebacterium doosanense TaxID=1121358 RepID=UPI0012DDFD07|nr:hypothetical protein [Corynebacterium doosanense]